MEDDSCLTRGDLVWLHGVTLYEDNYRELHGGHVLVDALTGPALIINTDDNNPGVNSPDVKLLCADGEIGWTMAREKLKKISTHSRKKRTSSRQ